MVKTNDKSVKRLIQCYLSYIYDLSYIFLIGPLLKARAEIQKYFRWFFGSNENFKICF